MQLILFVLHAYLFSRYHLLFDIISGSIFSSFLSYASNLNFLLYSTNSIVSGSSIVFVHLPSI